MSIVDDIVTVLDAAPDAALAAHVRGGIVVEENEDGDAIVRYDPPTHVFAKQIIGQEVPKLLEDSRFRFRVRREGSISSFPGHHPSSSTGDRFSTKRAYEQRVRAEPYLVVSYPDPAR